MFEQNINTKLKYLNKLRAKSKIKQMKLRNDMHT